MASLVQFAKHLWNSSSHASSNTKWEAAFGKFTEVNDGFLTLGDGEKFDLKTLENKVVLIVNTACGCGYTKPNFSKLIPLKEKFGPQGFEILAFPSNQFGGQEPGNAEEINTYITENFSEPNFPIMEKSDVNGDNTNPMYQFLKKCFPGDITWNFSSKFIVNSDGIPVNRIEGGDFNEIESVIENLIKEREAKTSTPAE